MQRDYAAALCGYRMEMAAEMLEAARRELDAESWKSANNRAYYAIFHAMRAILALDGVDFKKHSGVISYFNQRYIASACFSKECSRTIRDASLVRNKSDYDDFYICSGEDTA